MIQEAAFRFWKLISALACNSEPKFSSGWLDDFKKHYNLKKHKQHDEAVSADHADSEKSMIVLQALIDEYDMKNSYNMNETELYWKMTSDITLVTESQAGRKKEKTCITVINCFNVSESCKLASWIIETAETSCYFERNKIHISSLDMKWRHNAKIWMNTAIMMKYLQWFDSQMTDQKILLLINNDSVYECTAKLLKENDFFSL